MMTSFVSYDSSSLPFSLSEIRSCRSQKIRLLSLFNSFIHSLTAFIGYCAGEIEDHRHGQREREREREMKVRKKAIVVIVFTLKVLIMMSSSSNVSSAALYLLGDSSVDCGDNTLFYPIFHHNLSLHPCNGSDSSLLPHFLAEKMGFPYTPPFLTQNGTLQGLLNGLNFGSAQATIMNVPTGNHPLQSLNQQLRQVFETFQLLELQLSPENAHHFIKSSVFYLSFGKDDYTNLFLRNSSGIRFKYDGHAFAHVLVNEIVRVMRNLYAANVRKIVCMGILPLGCAPRILWERHNTTDIGVGDATRECVGEVNLRVLEYNTMLEERVVELNSELSEAQIVFCDVYQGIMKIIENPTRYGFEEVKMACCGLGPYGGMAGCVDPGLACHDASTHVWWDLYNPTPAVNSLLADSAWFGQPMPNICRPVTVKELATAPILPRLV